ncbi:MAG: AAC(3) family N-acetyltransferase [Lentisphaeria bacterium]|nr:AAC(3) family N-acetyltransferase [Lentisphaeria bacterium]
MKEFCYDLSSQEIKKYNRSFPQYTSQEGLANALHRLGLRKGNKVIVHSSLGSLGTFEGGAEGVCRVLMEYISNEGTLMMPGLVKYPSNGEDFTYIPETTPVGVGLIPDTFRKFDGVLRSLDPTHSFSVWGKDKIKYIKDHHKLPTMHRNTPLGLLEQDGGYCLLIGCPTKTTFMHVVETACGASCLGSRTEEYPAVISGQKVKLRGWGWRNGECRALRHQEIFDYMRDNNSLSECMLGRCHLMLFKLSAYRESYSRLLTAKENGCAGCPVTVRKVAQSVESDWDFTNGCLKESDAFTGDFFS